MSSPVRGPRRESFSKTCRAPLRSSETRDGPPFVSQRMDYGTLVRGGHPIAIRNKALKLLEAFIRSPGRVLTCPLKRTCACALHMSAFAANAHINNRRTNGGRLRGRACDAPGSGVISDEPRSKPCRYLRHR